ncbi:DNA double-strand break repair protein Mre11 [Halopenitus sp. H-Gu1]|uniref:DNA double-strand break repair protein Mre11 n=1 Tax=Halopenitus sp. H-Gu1 TaxID=3242697 RepID=UPI00359D2407
MTRVIHTGDTHIGYRQYNSPVRRRDFLEAFEAVIDDAVSSDVDAVIHAGDLFHDRRPELPDLLGTLSVLRRLEEADVPFLAIVGNHEATRGGQWLDLFERLGLATRLGDSPTVVGNVAFYGLDHVPSSRRSDLEYDFEPHDVAHAALVAHGLFEPFAYADWDTETVIDESDVSFGALLLGDNHEPGRATVRDAWVTYPGSTERASTSEREGRGYNLVSFGEATDGETDVDIRRRSIETRPFVFIEIELHEGEGTAQVTERVRQHDLDDAVAIVEIEGDGEPVTPAAIEEVASDEGALIARVTDRREIETETDLEVSFADPDDAVRERIESMDLSPAALDVDETVRASKIADSNVRETVKDRLEERLADDELRSSDGSPELGSEPKPESANPESEPESESESKSESESDSEPHATEGDDGSEDADTEETDVEKPDEKGSDDGRIEGDQQLSMEDYR